MKKLFALLLVLVCAIGLIGCNNKETETIADIDPGITGVVTEIYENSFLMHGEPTVDYPAGADYNVSLKAESENSYTYLAVGDEVVVYHSGDIAESDPLQINTVSAIELKTPAPNDDENDKTDMGKIVKIIDRTQNEDIAVDTALEMFYEDKIAEYYFSGMMSEYILAEYENGSRKTVKEALEIGDITIEDLDRFNVNYIVEAKSKTLEEHHAISSIPDDLSDDEVENTTAETEKIPPISDVEPMNYNTIKEVLFGKDIQEIREIWGEPTKSDGKEDVWQLDDFMLLVISYDNTGIIENCELISGTPLAPAK